MEIQKRIQQLPRVIQDLIGEFNVEHREFTRRLEKELFSIIRQACPCCNTPYTKWCSIEYFICQKQKQKTKVNMFWCDSQCFKNDPDLETKTKTAQLIYEYLVVSIQNNMDLDF